ncbi:MULTISPECIES: RagB/SusD family nutrient uptake outer membrane protein [Marinifilum]|uniref:RagB/SusD family nutrient uptake outer membrane protein n=1 Tax=Marinifilum TaxID=866673 RepID=UPI002274AF10|nr:MULTISPECIES: RagB/SusD family nutrient uptake outer membrane protein [Marinifilum]MCY1636155.1 RagB/SusD family nutrient uptake outer membrane protein [Marinifilum sp. D737]
MKKITFLNILLLLLCYSCDDFLEENPNKSGNDPILEVEQLDALLNSISLSKSAGSAWMATFFASDDSDIRPELYKIHTSLSTRVALGIWNKETYENLFSVGWESLWREMFRINTIIESAPKVNGNEVERKKVAAEAKFHRAFLHFLGVVEFCLHPSVDNGETPGIGYRDNTNGEADLSRKTVRYTIDKIIQDLTEAEVELQEIGLNNFDISTNWRITVPAVQAFRARVEMYIAKNQDDFDKAAAYADKALKGYNKMVNIATDPLFSVEEKEIVGSSKFWKELNFVKNGSNTGEYKECYFPYTVSMPSYYTEVCPVSESLYNLYSEKDLRKLKFIQNNYNYISVNGLPFDLTAEGIKDIDAHSFYRFNHGGIAFLIGPTVSEMHLIKAEAFARKGEAAKAISELRILRANRFEAEDISIVNNIGGTVADVKNERRRELPFVIRWYDLKRYNQYANEQITVTKKSFDDVYNTASSLKTYILEPQASAYALPIPEKEIRILGWKQNDYAGIVKQ